jgi:hypothetical protein
VRRLKLAIGAVLLLGACVGLAQAQTSVPSVTVTAANGNITLSPAGPIGGGPTRFTYDGPGELTLATLRAGVSVDQLRATLARNDEAALNLVFLEAAVPDGRSVSVTLRPNTTYVAAAVGRRSAITTFTTGPATGATAARPDARIRMIDYAFRGPRTLPRNGSIRVQNAGTTFHFAVAFPLRKGVTNRQAGRALRTGRGIGRIAGGEPVDVQGLISQGSTNDNEVRFGRRGRFAMVCFFAGHNRLGMYRVYRVR